MQKTLSWMFVLVSGLMMPLMAWGTAGDALLESSTWDGSVYLFSGQDNSLTEIATYFGDVKEIAALPDGDALIIADSGELSHLYRYNAATKTMGSPLLEGGLSLGPILILPNSDALIGSPGYNGSVWLYKSSTHVIDREVATFIGSITKMTVLPNGNAYIGSAGGGGQVIRYLAASETTDGPQMTYAGTIYQLTSLSDNKALFAIGDAGGSVWMYRDNLTAKQVATYCGETQQQVALPGGEALMGFSESGGSLWRYDSATESVVGRLMTYTGTFQALSTLPDGDALIGISGGSGSLYRYDATTKAVDGSAIGTVMGTVRKILTLTGGDALITIDGTSGSLWRYNAATKALQNDPVGTYMGATTPMAALSGGDALVGDAAGSLWRYSATGHGLTQVGTGLGTLGEITGLAAARVTIYGTITLQDFADDPTSVSVTLEVRNVGSTTPLESQPLTLKTWGYYTTTVAQSGTLDVAVKASHWLRSVRTLSLTGEVNADFTLINGDADGDNEVSSSDMALVLRDIGLSTGTDLNEDGSVNTADLSIVLANFDRFGDR